MDAEEFQAFIKSYESPSLRGLRWNLLKDGNGSDGGRAVPWCKEGFIFPTDERPAKSIFYHAGLYYIQEPSAMCPAEVLVPKPDERVLDICAAPGGKSVQIAGHMRGRGLLVSNDASPSRSRALVKNLERAGVTNAIVLTDLPKKLSERFPEFFDCILVDAPCSGEGMFRRDADLIKAYTANKPEACVLMQREILHFAAMMLKPGGRLVYSTCTFNPMENEGVIAEFLDGHEDFELIPIDHSRLGLQQGRADWVASDNSKADLRVVARIWPHLATGEGHFIALLEKKTTDGAMADRVSPAPIQTPREFSDFCNEFLNIPISYDYLALHGASLYLQPERLDLRGLRVARSGWHLGECAKGRFVPSQALAMGLRKEQVKFTIDLSEEDAKRYLRGDSLELPSDFVFLVTTGKVTGKTPEKPWVLACFEGFPLGWARLVQGRLKNGLPTGWVTSL